MTNWTKEPKNIVTLTKEALVAVAQSFLLMEDGFHLLYENSSRILLENGLFWTKEAKPSIQFYFLFQDESFFNFQEASLWPIIDIESPVWTKEAKV